jgi:hypothetical protein
VKKEDLLVPSELLLLLSDPLMGPAIYRFVEDVRKFVNERDAIPPLAENAGQIKAQALREAADHVDDHSAMTLRKLASSHDRGGK